MKLLIWVGSWSIYFDKVINAETKERMDDNILVEEMVEVRYHLDRIYLLTSIGYFVTIYSNKMTALNAILNF